MPLGIYAANSETLLLSVSSLRPIMTDRCANGIRTILATAEGLTIMMGI